MSDAAALAISFSATVRSYDVDRPRKPGMYDTYAYHEGDRAGRDVGLDPQVGHNAKGALK